MTRMSKIVGWENFKRRRSRAGVSVDFPVSLLDSFAFASLPLEGKALAPLLILLAAESKDGLFPRDADWLAFRLRLHVDAVTRGLVALSDASFIETIESPDAPAALQLGLSAAFGAVMPVAPAARAAAPALPKISGSEVMARFETEFWPAYPRRQAKAAAEKAFLRLAPDAALMTKMLAALRVQAESADWCKDGGQFIPLPATWLNGRRWEDEAAADLVVADPYDARSAL